MFIKDVDIRAWEYLNLINENEEEDQIKREILFNKKIKFED